MSHFFTRVLKRNDEVASTFFLSFVFIGVFFPQLYPVPLFVLLSCREAAYWLAASSRIPPLCIFFFSVIRRLSFFLAWALLSRIQAPPVPHFFFVQGHWSPPRRPDHPFPLSSFFKVGTFLPPLQRRFSVIPVIRQSFSAPLLRVSSRLFFADVQPTRHVAVECFRRPPS